MVDHYHCVKPASKVWISAARLLVGLQVAGPTGLVGRKMGLELQLNGPNGIDFF
jgi:hypothetical protein